MSRRCLWITMSTKLFILSHPSLNILQILKVILITGQIWKSLPKSIFFPLRTQFLIYKEETKPNLEKKNKPKCNVRKTLKAFSTGSYLKVSYLRDIFAHPHSHCLFINSHPHAPLFLPQITLVPSWLICLSALYFLSVLLIISSGVIFPKIKSGSATLLKSFRASCCLQDHIQVSCHSMWTSDVMASSFSSGNSDH